VQKTIITIVKFILFLSVGLIILYLVYKQQNTAYQAQCALDGVTSADCSLLNKIISDFGRVNYAWIVVVVACFMISNWSRAVRWKMLIEPLGHQISAANSFWAVNLGYFANLGLPRMGEVVRAATIARYEKIPVEKVMGTIVVDRLLDLVCLAIVVGLAFSLEFDTLYDFLNQNMNKGNSQSLGSNPIILGILGTGVISLLSVIIFWKKLITIPFIKKILDLAKGFWEGILSIKEAKNPFMVIIHSINIWLMYYLMAYFCFFAFPPTHGLSPIVALMVYTFGAFGVLIPSPGGMGTYHALVVAALAIYNIDGTNAFSFANIFFFSVNIFGSILFGLLSLLFLPYLNKTDKK
jgi:glycosyltransferase 2 family protein